MGNVLGAIAPVLLNGIAGIIAGGVVLLIVNLLSPMFRMFNKEA
jgi:predicted DNA repair protein MutK